MDSHVKVLGVLYILLGGLGLLMALTIAVVFGGMAGLIGIGALDDPDAFVAIPILGIIGTLVVGLLLLLSLPSVLAGIGLLKFRPWARILGLVLAVLHLINFPIGTVIGLYGLWVLLTPETAPLFERGGTLPVAGGQ